MPAGLRRAHEMPRRRANVPGLTDRIGVDVNQDTDCKVCGGEVWDDSPIPLCRECMIRASGFASRQQHRAVTDWSYEAISDQDVAEAMAGVRDLKPQVYYLRFGDRIKIGCSVAPAKRVMALSMDPANIVATEHGGFRRERERHLQFADLRLEGEWFAAGDELLAHIESLVAA